MQKNNIKIKYLVYARKSSEQEDKQVLSISSQRDELNKIVKDLKLSIVKVFEESHSAKEPGRPIFNEMMSCLSRGEANGILIWNPNRISRNSMDTGQVIYFLDLGKLLEVRTP